MEIAQAAFAVLDVRLDQIARLPRAADAVLALGELGGDELRRGVAHHLVVEARLQLVEQFFIAEQEARFQMAVRMVMSALAWRMHSSTERVAWPTLSPVSHRQ